MTTCACARMYSVSPCPHVHTQLVMFLTSVSIIPFTKKPVWQTHALFNDIIIIDVYVLYMSPTGISNYLMCMYTNNTGCFMYSNYQSLVDRILNLNANDLLDVWNTNYCSCACIHDY